MHVWRTDRDLQPALLGRWGTITGALALGDAERAMRAFSAILITIMCTVGGAPAPSEPTLGLVPLIQATACLDDTTHISLLDECYFERIFQQHQLRLSDSSAAPADPEAVFLDATANAVKPLADQAASQRAGTQAGLRPASTLLQHLSRRRLAVSSARLPRRRRRQQRHSSQPRPKPRRRRPRRPKRRRQAPASSVPRPLRCRHGPSHYLTHVQLYVCCIRPCIRHLPSSTCTHTAEQTDSYELQPHSHRARSSFTLRMEQCAASRGHITPSAVSRVCACDSSTVCILVPWSHARQGGALRVSKHQ